MKRIFSNLVLMLSFWGLLVACSSVKKAEISPTAEPSEEIYKLDTDINAAVAKNIDVLAASEFKESKKYLRKAKDALADKESQENILDELRTGRGYLEKSYALSENRESNAKDLLAARQMALEAGANRHPELQSELADLDDDVSAKADSFNKTSVEKLVEFQKRYVELERRAVVLTQLGRAQAIVKGAQKDSGKKKAPISFKTAELSLKAAESVVSTNVRNPQGYQQEVEKANKDAVQLLNVLTTIEQSGKDLDESTAIKMVGQNKKISGLITDLDTVTAQSEARESALKAESQKLEDASSKVQVQQILEKARTQFSKDEADAYQQGENLVIRLKQINFATGRADLPAESLPLLAKVSDIAKSLHASQIVIEGHTDSVGSPALNKTLSDERAEAVASYLKANGFEDTKIESEGFGFKKPIATNRSKEGRAQNRRVDIIITPETLIE